MLLRKLVAALFSSIILSLCLFLMSSWDSEQKGFILLVLIFALFGNFIYGIPVSFISEALTKSLKKSRAFVAGFIYVFLAYITEVVIEGLAIFSIISAVLFYLIDEGIKVVKETPSDKSKKLHFLKLLSVIPFAALAIWGVHVQTTSHLEETNNVYLIPEEYEGSIVVFYNMPNEDNIAKEGEFFKIPLRVEELPTLKGSGIEEYAIFQTSSEWRSGRVTDKYFYVDELGNRSEIKKSCIHYGPGSSSMGMKYEVFQITNSSCGEDFQWSGKERYDAQTREILRYWGYY
ncbi:hypothetical protein B4U37_19170 [Sutcliffiella horikoshii]|uniref:DUF6843 domain-containing protein n=1 Tax=Sutcliffiella horikoshii TaxID=79883 RepID=A0ABM6KNE3_9BACI|nr:hypothetical protein [Sutcliffiella horikoshii]ART78025.1 hypothetical protein B4U37_19170 [Sutcliffiella horikoshii]